MREIDEGYNDRGPGVLVASCSGVLRGYSHHGRGHLQVWPRSLPKWSYRERDTSFLNLVHRALFPGFGGGAGKCPGIGWPIRHFDWLIDLGTSRKKMAKWKQFMHYCEKSKRRKACPLQRRFLQEIQVAGYVVVLMRVAICLEYSARPAYLKICVWKFIKPVAML